MTLVEACRLALLIAQRYPQWVVKAIQRTSVSLTVERYAVDAWSAQDAADHRFESEQDWQLYTFTPSQRD